VRLFQDDHIVFVLQTIHNYHIYTIHRLYKPLTLVVDFFLLTSSWSPLSLRLSSHSRVVLLSIRSHQPVLTLSLLHLVPAAAFQSFVSRSFLRKGRLAVQVGTEIPWSTIIVVLGHMCAYVVFALWVLIFCKGTVTDEFLSYGKKSLVHLQFGDIITRTTASKTSHLCSHRPSGVSGKVVFRLAVWTALACISKVW